MKPVKDETLDSIEHAALDSATAIRGYFATQGPEDLKRAKLGVAVISGFARLRATENGRMAVELAIGKTSKRKK